MKKNGISLIVLVITIIVMIILAASVVITLSNTGVIDKANDAVNSTNDQQIQELAAMVWAESYMEGLRGQELIDDVTEKLNTQKITTTDWYIKVTDKGVTVKEKNNLTLGDLIISALDYGKTINYVSDNGVTDWKVFYHTDDYVYLIASEKIAKDKIPTNIPGTVVAEDGILKETGNIGWNGKEENGKGTIQNPSMWMAEWSDYTKNKNAIWASFLIDEKYWEIFKNTTAEYSRYIEGAIGTPTLELFVASWNAKRLQETNTNKIELTFSANGTNGYYLNSSTSVKLATSDDLYTWKAVLNGTSIWLAAPFGLGTECVFVIYGNGTVGNRGYSHASDGLRPVVCLKSDIPAKLGTAETTDYVI
ncbi:MAG: type II secretion system protein [Clostridia bacterium]|nr:type II secretion system protein [Clostridia bacterium]